MRVLVVKSAFGGHSRGSKITDPAEIEAILSGESAHHVIQSEHSDEDHPHVAHPIEETGEPDEQEQE